MPDPKQRIIVDGVEFASIFRFHRILLSVTAAMQPPRLVIGLLMVTALITAGRLWDRFDEPSVPPQGLLQGEWTNEDRREALETVRASLAAFGTAENRLPMVPPDASQPVYLPRDVVQTLRESHRIQVEADPAQRPRLDREYERTLRLLGDLLPRGTFEAAALQVTDGFNRVIEGVLILEPAEVFAGTADVFFRTPRALWNDHRAFLFGYGLILLLVISVGGGALARMAACQWATRERIGVREAVDFALSSWSTLILAPLLPLVLVALVAILVVLLSLLLKLPWRLDILGAVAYGPALLLGALLAFLIIGYLAGLILLTPAVACEKCDAADAQQRAYAYVLNRPLHLLGYLLVALVGLALGYAVVSFFVVLLLNGTAALFGMVNADHPALAHAGGSALFSLTPPRPHQPTLDQEWVTGLIGFWQTLVLCLVPAWVLAYFFAATTKVYLLMRYACDGQDPQEIWRPGLIPGTLSPAPEPEAGGDGDS